jgi:hypothetical protein
MRTYFLAIRGHERSTGDPKLLIYKALAETETVELIYLRRSTSCIFAVTNPIIPPLIPPWQKNYRSLWLVRWLIS